MNLGPLQWTSLLKMCVVAENQSDHRCRYQRLSRHPLAERSLLRPFHSGSGGGCQRRFPDRLRPCVRGTLCSLREAKGVRRVSGGERGSGRAVDQGYALHCQSRMANVSRARGVEDAYPGGFSDWRSRSDASIAAALSRSRLLSQALSKTHTARSVRQDGATLSALRTCSSARTAE